MMTVYANPLLNLVWAAVCLAAFGWFLSFERRHRSGRGATGFRALALGLALISLFPCVSASDDSVRLEMLGAAVPSTPGHPSSERDRETDRTNLATLVRLLEVLESVQITVSLAWSVVFCLFAMALIENHKSLDRFLPARAGRAPPSL